MLRLSSLEQRVHVAAGLITPDQLAEAVQVQLPLEAGVLVFCKQEHRNNNNNNIAISGRNIACRSNIDNSSDLKNNNTDVGA